MQPMIGVVGALYILQGATYVYESLFGKIQPSQANDSSLSTEDGCTSDEFANLTAKQRRKKRKIERRKALAAGSANPESESEGQTLEEPSTSLAEVTTGASSSSDPVEEISQARPAQATTKHQGTSQTKDQGTKESVQNKQDPGKGPRSSSPDTVDDSVPSTSSKTQPKNKVQLLTSQTKKGDKREETKKHTCDNAKKNAPTASKKEQSKKQPVTHNQRPTCESKASKKGCKEIEPKKHTCVNTEKNVLTTSNKDQTKKESTHKDQCSTSEALVGKKGGKGKDQMKHTSDIAKKNVPSTSNKEQAVRQSAIQDRSPNREVDAGKKCVKVGEPTKPNCDKAKKNAPTTSRKEQPKKQPTHKDQGLFSEAESAKTVCKGKEPKKHTCSNAKKNVATTSSNYQPKKYSSLQDQSPTFKAYDGKKGGKVKGPKTLSCDGAKKNVPPMSSKKQPKGQPAHKDQGQTLNAEAAQEGCKGKEPKKSSSDSAERSDPTTSSKESTKKKETTKTDKNPSCKAHTAKKGGSREETEKPICENKEKCGPTTSVKQQLRKEQDHCEASTAKNKGKGKKSKKQSSDNVKSLPGAAASSKEQVKQESIQKDQGPTCEADAGKKEGKEQGVKCDTDKKMTTSESNDQYFAKVGETPCMPGDSKEVEDQSTNSIKDSDSEWILVGKHNTTRHKDKGKMGPSGKCQARSQKTPAPGIGVEKEIQPKSSAGPAQTSPGDKDLKAEEPPKKKRPTRRAKKKPKKGKPNPSVTSAAKEEDLPVSPQEQNSTDVAVVPRAVVNTWANIVKSKPIVDTLPLHNEKKGTGSQGEETQDEKMQKETELEKSVTEIPWNVPVTYKKCIGCKKKAPCAEPKNIITTGKIVEPLTKSSASITTSDIQEVQGSLLHPSNKLSTSSPITQEAEMKGSDTVATLDKDEVCGPLQPPANQLNISSPDTQEAGIKDSADDAPQFKQESTGSLLPLTNQPNTDSPITQETEMKNSIRQRTEKPIPAILGQQEEVLHVLGLSIPNFPVKLEDEREEEAKDSSSERHDTELFMTHDENCIITPSMKNVVEESKPEDPATSETVLTTSATQTGELEKPSIKSLSVSEPFQKRRFTEQATGTKVLTSTATQTDEHALKAVKSLLTCAPFSREPTDDKLVVKAEVPKLVPEKSTQNAPKKDFSQMSALSPAFVPRNATPAVTPKTTLLKCIEDPTTQAVNSLMAATSGPSDRMLTVKSEVQRSLPVRYAEVVPTTNLPQMPAFHPACSPYPTSTLIQQHCNTSTAVNSPTTMVAYTEDPSTLQYGTTYYQNYNYPAPTTGTWQIGYESTLYNAYSTYAPVHQRPILSPVIEPYMQTTFPVASLRVAPNTKAALPTPSCITESAPLQCKKQQSNSTGAVKQVVQKSHQVPFSAVVPTTSAPLEIASPSATETPEAAAQLKQQQTNTTPAIQQVVQKLDKLTSSKVVPTINAHQERASPTATDTSKAAAPLQQQCFSTTVTEQIVQKQEKVTLVSAVHTTTTPVKKASPTATETPKAVAPVKKQKTDITPTVRPVVLQPDKVTSSKVVPTTNATQEIASPSATNTPKAASPLKQQQTYTTPAIQQVVQKLDQVTSTTVVPTINEPQGIASPSAIKTPKAATPLKQQQTNTTNAVKQIVLKPDQKTSSKVVSTINVPQEIASPSATETPKAAVPLTQKQKSTTPAIQQVVQKVDQVTSTTVVPTINEPQGIAPPSAIKTPKAASLLKQQQPNTTPAVKQVVLKPDQVASTTVVPTINEPQGIASPSAIKTPKAATPLKQQQTNTTNAVKQIVLKPEQKTSSKVVSTINVPQEIASPSATETPKAAVPLTQQQKSTTPAIQQVVQKVDQVTSTTVVPTINEPQGIAPPSAIKTPKAASLLKQQQPNTTPAVKQVVLKPDQVTSTTVVPTINEPQGIASPSAIKTPKAAAPPLMQQQTNTIPAVKQVVQKPDQVTSSKVVSTTNAPLEIDLPSGTDKPKAASPLKQQQTNTTPTIQQVEKPDQGTSSTVVPTISAPQGIPSPSATKTPKAASPLKQQQTNTTHVVNYMVKPDQVTSSAVVPTTNAPQGIASPTATETPKAVAPVKNQKTDITPVKQVVLKPDQVTSSTVAPTTNATQEIASPSATKTPKASPPLKQPQKSTTPAVKQVLQKPDQVTSSSTVVPTTNAPQGIASPSATKTPKATPPLIQQKTNTILALQHVVQKPDQVTSSKVVSTTSAPLDIDSPSATRTPKAASPLKQQQTNTIPAVHHVVQRPNQVTSSKVVPTTNAYQERFSPSASKPPKAASLLEQQQKNTFPAVKQVVQKPDQVTPLTLVPNVNAPLEIASPSATETPKAAAPFKQQQINTTPAVKHVLQKPDQVKSSNVVPTIHVPLEIDSLSATKTPKAAAPLKQHQKNTTPDINQVVLNPDQVVSSKVELISSAPLEIASPSATKAPKAAAPIQQQQTNTIPAVKQVVQMPDQVTSSKVVSTTDAPQEIAPPSATETPKAAAPLKQQQTNTIPAVKQVVQKLDRVPSSKFAPTTNAPLEKASLTTTDTSNAAIPLPQQQNNTVVVEQIVQKPNQVTSLRVVHTTSTPVKKALRTATETPKAVALLKQTNTTSSVKQVIKKSDHVPSSKNGPTTNAPLKKAAPTALKRSKVAAMCRNQQVNTTPYKQVVQKPQVASPNEMTSPDTSQERALPVSTHATKADNTSSQSVRPKERVSVATPSSSKLVETSATTQDQRSNRSARRRRARGRQRERKRAAEAERRAAEGEEKAATETEGAAAVLEQTEEADSSNHHEEVASSRSSEIILNFDDDSEFVIDWEAEAAKPFYNSTEIFPPRVEIPEWAQWDFSEVCTILASHLYWQHPEFQTKGITLMAATMIYIALIITKCWKYLSCFISCGVGYSEEDISWIDFV